MLWYGLGTVLTLFNWMGKIPVDPVFSGNASPVPGSVKAFEGSNHYQPEDMPVIDVYLSPMTIGII
jgi:L-ascorbate metabolism protein UlaG (beta-lactamase superfamily)